MINYFRSIYKNTFSIYFDLVYTFRFDIVHIFEMYQERALGNFING